MRTARRPGCRQCGEYATFIAAGENIARGGVTPRRMMRLWMHSSGHRANILNPNFTHLGVGAARRNGTWTGVQDFAGF